MSLQCIRTCGMWLCMPKFVGLCRPDQSIALSQPYAFVLCRTVLQLYRNIVRTHRNVLPPPLRAMGDTYARDEFRRHWKPATTKSQWQAFVQEWQRSLNEEQKAQLARLKQEAVKAREAILSGKPGDG